MVAWRSSVVVAMGRVYGVSGAGRPSSGRAHPHRIAAHNGSSDPAPRSAPATATSVDRSVGVGSGDPAWTPARNARPWCVRRAGDPVTSSPWRTPTDTHEWVSFEDEDEERTWVFDVTFLTSNWTCIFGNGCQGVLTGPAPELVQGCCSYGAHLVDKKDARHVEKVAATLTRRGVAEPRDARRAVIHTNKHGETVTRLRRRTPASSSTARASPPGPGCALPHHGGAARRQPADAQARGLLAAPPTA